MSISVIIVDGTTGGTNTNVVKVITQTSVANGANVNTQVNKGFILTSSSLQTVNLPNGCSIGDVIALHGNGTGLFKIVQRAGEQILFGNTPSTVGVTGSVESTNQNDSIYLICVDSAGIWTPDNGTFGKFLIDGSIPNNAVNDPTTGSDFNPSSPSNNVILGGTYPNLTFDVGVTSSGLRNIVINNVLSASHSADTVSIGDNAGLTSQAEETLAVFPPEVAVVSQGVCRLMFQVTQRQISDTGKQIVFHSEFASQPHLKIGVGPVNRKCLVKTS